VFNNKVEPQKGSFEQTQWTESGSRILTEEIGARKKKIDKNT
jgi:hypothetical protein